MTRMSLFDQTPSTHDPGGSKLWPLMAGTNGSARFSQDGRYRQWLQRWFYDGVAPQEGKGEIALWIGMNPSTATATFDDPTVRWETIFTMRELQCLRYIKCNVCDLRATNPAALRDKGVKPRSDENLTYIRKFAEQAHYVVCAWGRMSHPLEYLAEETTAMLTDLKIDLWCLGRNLDGSPKHPLYLPRTGISLMPFRRAGKAAHAPKGKRVLKAVPRELRALRRP